MTIRLPDFGGIRYINRVMTLFASILFWTGIVLMMDGSLALLFQEKWQKMAGNLNIQRIALIELGVSVLLLVAHYGLR